MSQDFHGVVVVDTNIFPRGQYRSSTLQHIVDDCTAADFLVVVPEIVVLELAEHAKKQMAEIRKAASGLDPCFEFTVRNDDGRKLASYIRGSITDLDAEVRSHKPDTYSKAVIDQVLVEGAGTVRKGQKTGAADSLVLTLAEELFASHGSCLLLTGDKRLKSAAERLTSVECASLSELATWLDIHEDITEADESEIERTLDGWLSRRGSDAPFAEFLVQQPSFDLRTYSGAPAAIEVDLDESANPELVEITERYKNTAGFEVLATVRVPVSYLVWTDETWRDGGIDVADTVRGTADLQVKFWIPKGDEPIVEDVFDVEFDRTPAGLVDDGDSFLFEDEIEGQLS